MINIGPATITRKVFLIYSAGKIYADTPLIIVTNTRLY